MTTSENDDVHDEDDRTVHSYEDLTLTSVNVRYTPDGDPQDLNCSFAESGGMAFFEINGDTAKYDGHVHSIDRDKAEEAVGRLPFINTVDMKYER